MQLLRRNRQQKAPFKRYCLIAIGFACICLFPAAAATQEKIHILNAQSGAPVVGATLSLEQSGRVLISDSTGTVLITTLSGKAFVSHVSYQNRVIDLAKLRANQILLYPTTKQLDEVAIRGFDLEGKLLDNAGAIAVIAPEQLGRFSESSMVPVLNSLPGIRMEERSTGSYRISIRGSLLRSPFGVRNLKVYWNDIPFTEPNGNTPFNLLDINNMGKVEVIKGPASSIYGAGTGGVINIEGLKAPFNRQILETGVSMGSFNTLRYSTSLLIGNDKTNISANLTRHSSDGYRDHSALSRNVGQILGHFGISPKRVLSVSLLFSDLDYQIPGGLTQMQYDDNPRQSRPGSISQNASIDINTLQIGLAQNYQFSESLSNTTSIYGLSSIFRNPFITDYKREAQQAMGGRSRFFINTEVGGMALRINSGVEFQTSFTNARNFGNVLGQPDTIRFDDEIRATQSIIFTQVQLYLQPDFIFVAGASANTLSYKVNRLIDVISGSPSKVERQFDTELSPRVGLTKRFGAVALHASASFGFSPPTVAEFRTNEGSLNTNLNAEHGLNYEIGFRGTGLKNKLNFDLAIFAFKLKQTIVTRTAPSGVVIFENAGETSQPGAELFLNYKIIEDPNSFFAGTAVQTSYTYHNFEFGDYIKRQNDFSGNALTGVAPHILVTAFDIKTRPGFYAHFTHNYTDRIPLNDANDVHSSAYNLIEIKAGWRKQISSLLDLNLFAGINNLLDEKYSLGNDLNPFGGRFFQPAPDRNYYGGMKMRWNLVRK